MPACVASICTSAGRRSIITGLLAQNLLEPMLPSMMLPEVSDPKNWWGGHIWADNAKEIYLQLHGLHDGDGLVQLDAGQTRRDHVVGQPLRPQMEREDRDLGSTLAGLR